MKITYKKNQYKGGWGRTPQKTMTEKEIYTGNLVWAAKEMRNFNKRNNAPLGEAYAEGNENVIVSENVRVLQDGRMGKSSQMMVIGGHDSGKTYNVIRPNLMRAFGSYVVVDSDGSLLEESRKKLEQSGYEIKVLDFAAPANSDHYNPLKYVYTDQDVTDIVDCILDNAQREAVKTSDPFWNKTEASIFTAAILYVLHFLPEDNHTMAKVRELIELAIHHLERFDALFEKAREMKCSDSAIIYYDSARLATAKTLRAACTAVAIHLNSFDGDEKDDLSLSDSLELERLCDFKTAVFLTGFDINRTQSILIPLLINQVFTTTCPHVAQGCENGKTAYLLTLMLDDLQRIGRIPRLAIHLTTCRKYGISAIIATQTIGQLRAIYQENAETIFDSCRITVYMSGASHFNITRLLCDETIGTNEGEAAKKDYSSLILVEDMQKIPSTHCLVSIPGMPVYVDKKYRCTED